ncbi:MAG: hypothetical protein KF685_02590 [Acidobacteria bacterium]|nr:hypothetical protein [Acidobacteriota bacterium]
MRDRTNREKIEEFMNSLGSKARRPVRVYFTGGTTAVLFGWRDTTIDIDLRFEPDLDELYRELPLLKEKIGINIELASPSDFIPVLPGWEDRSKYIDRKGKIDFYHYDPYSQALSKIERGHAQDIKDVESMFKSGLVEKEKLAELFKQIEPMLYRYPAIDPASFARAVSKIIIG